MPLTNGKKGKQQLNMVPTIQANNVHQTISQYDIVKYLHAAAFRPVVAMWVKSIGKGFFVTVLVLTDEKVKNYFPKSEATALGNLDQSLKNKRSTTY